MNLSRLSHTSDVLPNGREFSRLVNAAIISQDFCQLLLTSPAKALTTGYNGDSFDLTAEEQDLILSIRASSLVDFARQLTVHIQDTALKPNSLSERDWLGCPHG